MKQIKHIFTLLVLMLVAVSCNDFLDPQLDGTMTEEEVFKNAYYFTGPLMAAYDAIDNQYDIEMDDMTDNAVANTFSSSYLIAATGGLQPNNNPLAVWSTAYAQIRNVNQFFAKMKLDYSNKKMITPVRFFKLTTQQDSINNVRYYYRLRGEAFFVRAYWQAELLKRYGGVDVSGNLSGVPLVGDRVFANGDNLNLPRASYEECVQAVVADCDSASYYLPAKYDGTDVVTGGNFNGRASALGAKALKARVLLYAASPAFNLTGDLTKWVAAATAAADVIKLAGGLQALSTVDEFYFSKINDTKFENKDILWRGPIQTANRAYEITNYPQGYYGNAANNPSQNYVDAFPDAKGYPIVESTTYNAASPYANRDPRLSLYVAYDGSKIGPSDAYTLNCRVGKADAYVPLNRTSRSAYYLKKLLRSSVVKNVPGSLTGTKRTRIVFGLPEVYLSYAEAANEAWGVKSDPKGYGFTAYDALRKIQIRYGCGADYLNNVVGTDQTRFRAYIHNERRLELSFEGHYYYDLRRWLSGDSADPLNVKVYGMRITTATDGTAQYERIVLEQRLFASPYMPLPYTELAAEPALKQNKGWN